MDANTKGHGEGCGCSACQYRGATCGMWGHQHWGHMLIKLLIVMFIFWAGVQFGELKAVVEGNYGGGMMGAWGDKIFYANTSARGGTMNATWNVPTDGTAVRIMNVSTTTGR